MTITEPRAVPKGVPLDTSELEAAYRPSSTGPCGRCRARRHLPMHTEQLRELLGPP